MTTAPKAARQIFLCILNLNARYARQIEASALRTKKYKEETPTHCTRSNLWDCSIEISGIPRPEFRTMFRELKSRGETLKDQLSTMAL